MFRLIANWIVNGLALYLVSRLVTGIHLDGFGSALVAVAVISLVNSLVKPVLFVLTLPITILSLGLFAFILNALMLLLASAITPGFKVDGLATAIVASLL